jgi:hypothetical protein
VAGAAATGAAPAASVTDREVTAAIRWPPGMANTCPWTRSQVSWVKYCARPDALHCIESGLSVLGTWYNSSHLLGHVSNRDHLLRTLTCALPTTMDG